MGIDEEGGRQIAHRDDPAEQPAERGPVVAEAGGVLLKLARDAQHVGADHLPALRQVGLRHLDGVAHDAFDAVREQGVEIVLDRNGREKCEQDGREQRHEAEDARHLQVKAGARGLPAAGLENLDGLEAHNADDDEHQGGSQA